MRDGLCQTFAYDPSPWLIGLSGCQPLSSSFLSWRKECCRVVERELFIVWQRNRIFGIHGPKPEGMEWWRVFFFFKSIATCTDALHIYWIFTYIVLSLEDAQWGWEEKSWWLELENKFWFNPHKRFEGRTFGPVCDDISILMGRVPKLLYCW